MNYCTLGKSGKREDHVLLGFFGFVVSYMCNMKLNVTLTAFCKIVLIPKDWKHIYKTPNILKSRTLQRLWSQFCQPITHLYVTLSERSIFTGSLRLKNLIENFLWVKLLEWNFGFSSLQVKWEEPANNWSKMVARINLKERNWLRSGHKERAALGIAYTFISIKEMCHETRHELIKRASFGSS